MEEKDYILFEDYLQLSLPPEEVEAFELRLHQDPIFRDAFQLYKELNSHLSHAYGNKESHDDFTSNLQKISEAHFADAHQSASSEVQPAGKGVVPFKPWYYAVAASVVILLGITLFQQLDHPSYDDFSHDAISLTVRGDQSKGVQAAENAFNSGDFVLAAELFQELRTQDPDHKEFKLYHAISLIEIDQFSISDELLAQLAASASAYQDEARWYHALSKLKQDELAQCRSLLREISPQSDRYEEAKSLLNDLD